MRLSRKFKDLFSKIRYTYVYRSEYAASPKSCRVSGPPRCNRNSARSGMRTIAVIAAGVAILAFINLRPQIDSFHFGAFYRYVPRFDPPPDLRV